MDRLFCFLLKTKSVLRLKNRSRTGKTDNFSSPAQDPLVESDPTFGQNVSCMNLLYFFAVWDSKMAAVTKNSTEHENDNISITVLWILTKFVSE